MQTVTVSEAKASLSRLVQRALEGETISIGRRGVPEVVLVAVAHDSSPRALGTVLTDEKGAPVRVEDDFDDPLPEFEASSEASLFPA